MTCERWRDAISAGLDGEDTGIDRRLVDAHVDRCAACRAFRTDARAERRVRTSKAQAATNTGEPAPDMSRQVAKLAAIADRAATWTIVRGLLGVVAVEILVFSLPALVLGDEQETSAHSARHLGAFTVAYAVGLLVVVVRPARARTMLPVAAVLAGALLVTGVVDLANTRLPLIDEAQHLPQVLSVVLVWLIAVPSPRRRGRSRRSDPLVSPKRAHFGGERRHERAGVELEARTSWVRERQQPRA